MYSQNTKIGFPDQTICQVCNQHLLNPISYSFVLVYDQHFSLGFGVICLKNMGRQPNTMQQTRHLKFQCFLKPLIFAFSQAYFVTNGVKRFPKRSLRAKNSPCPSSYLNLLSRVTSPKVIVQSHHQHAKAKHYHVF